MKDRLWEITHGFEWPEPDEAKVSSPVPRGVGLSDGPRLPDYMLVFLGICHFMVVFFMRCLIVDEAFDRFLRQDMVVFLAILWLYSQETLRCGTIV